MMTKTQLLAILLTVILCTSVAQATPKASPRNLIFISIDGVSRRVLYSLLQKKRLPGIKQVIFRGNYRNMDGTRDYSGATPAYLQFFTGADSKYYYREKGHPRPLPKENTIFYGLEKQVEDLSLVLILSKPKLEKPRRNLAPYLTELEPHWALSFPEIRRTSQSVGDSVVATIKSVSPPFFLFVNFTDPEDAGLLYREGAMEYSLAIQRCDAQVLRLINTLKEKGIWDSTEFVLTTNFGFHKNSRYYKDMTDSWIASTQKIRRKGTLKDIVPTLYHLLGIDWHAIRPFLPGESLVY